MPDASKRADLMSREIYLGSALFINELRLKNSRYQGESLIIGCLCVIYSTMIVALIPLCPEPHIMEQVISKVPASSGTITFEDFFH